MSFNLYDFRSNNILGATRDIGVSFTKIVMRHRAVENKLKTFVGYELLIYILSDFDSSMNIKKIHDE